MMLQNPVETVRAKTPHRVTSFWSRNSII